MEENSMIKDDRVLNPKMINNKIIFKIQKLVQTEKETPTKDCKFGIDIPRYVLRAIMEEVFKQHIGFTLNIETKNKIKSDLENCLDMYFNFCNMTK